MSMAPIGCVQPFGCECTGRKYGRATAAADKQTKSYRVAMMLLGCSDASDPALDTGDGMGVSMIESVTVTAGDYLIMALLCRTFILETVNARVTYG